MENQTTINKLEPKIQKYFKTAKDSPTLSINEQSKTLIKQGHKVYSFGFGQSPFPVPSLVVNALIENANQKAYLPVKGLPELKAAVSAYNNSREILSSPEDILIGPGSKNLLYLLQVVLQGELLLPSPSWVSYAPQALMISKTIVWLATRAMDDWMLHPDTLEDHCRKHPGTQKLLILNYPSNPTGATYDKELLKALAKTARKYGVIILSDEIYGELYFEQAHESMAKFYPEGTIVSSGLSKWCGAGGWRLGTFSFPSNLRPLLIALSVAASETYSAVSAPIQYAAISAYQPHPDIELYLAKSRKILKSIAYSISQQLAAANIAHPKPKGGFYLLPDFEYYRETLLSRGIQTSDQLCKKLLEDTGVALLPGTDFGIPPERLQARLAFVDFDGQLALEFGHEDLDGKTIAKIAGHMFEGLERMVDWLNK